MNNVANAAHSFAARFVSAYGVPANKLENAQLAATLAGLIGDAADLFCDRVVGHWVNVEAGTKGM